MYETIDTMFTHEQPISKNRLIRSKKRVLGLGMAFVKPQSVKRNFTYKEYTLIAGVLVALVIVFALWFRQEPVKESHTLKSNKAKTMSLPEAAKSLVRRAITEIHL
jgi:hypothetical protein